MIFHTPTRSYIISESSAINTNASTLYKGHDELFKRQVAIKVISFDPSLSEKALHEQLSRANNEISALAVIGDMSLRVPCIIDKHYDSDNRKLYIIMQWINGFNLRQKTESAMKSYKKFISWMISLTEVLALMEKKKFYHNDIKPENIIIDPVDQLHLIDFNLTISDVTINEGTPDYIAPELSTHIEARKDKADMFSIGVMMYEYFAGQTPREYYDYGMNSAFNDDGSKPKEWDSFKQPKEFNKDIPENINKMIVKLMSRLPSNRYTSYDELKKELIKINKSLRW